MLSSCNELHGVLLAKDYFQPKKTKCGSNLFRNIEPYIHKIICRNVSDSVIRRTYVTRGKKAIFHSVPHDLCQWWKTNYIEYKREEVIFVESIDLCK